MCVRLQMQAVNMAAESIYAGLVFERVAGSIA